MQPAKTYALVEPNGFVEIMTLFKGSVETEAARNLREYTAIHEIRPEQVPADLTFRNAWRYSPETGIRVDMDAARNVHRDRMREKRKELFSEVNAAWMRAQMQGLDKEGIAEKYQELLDVPAAPEIEEAQTPEELKELWPTQTLGETPYIEPQPAPSQAREPYAWAGDVPLWSKAEFDAYMADFNKALAERAAALPVSEEPEPVAIEDEQYPQETEAVPEPPLDLPRIFRDADESPMAAAMRRVEEAEAFDAPLPEYIEPRDPVEEVFGPSDEQRLKAETDRANASLTGMRWRYDIAVRALNGNQDDIANLAAEATRRRVTVETVADRIVIQWKRRETALSQIKDIEDATLDAILATPDVAAKIVDTAIAQIKKVHDAAAN